MRGDTMLWLHRVLVSTAKREPASPAVSPVMITITSTMRNNGNNDNNDAGYLVARDALVTLFPPFNVSRNAMVNNRQL